MKYQEAQLRVQLQTEELMMMFLSSKETSESERKAVLSAQELATALRSERSQESTAWISWKTQVKRDTKELAEQGTKQVAGGNSLQHASVSLSTLGVDCSQPSTPTKKLLLQYNRRDPLKPTLETGFRRLLLLYRTRDQLPMKVLQTGKREKDSNSNVGRMRQNSAHRKSRSDGRWYQDQLILDWSATS